ncbi:MAG: insulinase family protein [Candidatus Shikimatogenerans sp. Tser]|uniref:Insulinase family protein n=1 Tax=Candidatus Shikimatogenerans sp. Tser TaxID=3158568 RepID=A0AAU7QQV8_9FLAO
MNNNILNFNILKYKLNNGIKVILNKNKNSYTISNNFYYHVGIKNDKIGIANFLEHYIIKKNKNNKNNYNYNKYIINNGGIINSFLTYDGSYFNNIVTKNKLNSSLYIMSEKFKNLYFKKKYIIDLINKINIKEKFLLKRSPYINLFHKFIPKYLFKNHPYKNTITSNIKKLKKYSITNYKKFYNKYYNSNNMIICISGNISFKKTKKMIYKHFNNFIINKKNNKKKYKYQPLNKKISYYKNININIPMGVLLFKFPNILNKDILIIKFIVYYLNNEYKNLILKKIKKKNNNIININLKLNIMEDYSYLIIYYLVNNKIYIKPLYNIIYNFFKKLSNKGISNKKIKIYKRLIIKKKIMDNLNNYDISINLTNYLALYNDVYFFKKEIKFYKKINKKLLIKIFKKYFLNKNIILLND